MSVTYGFYNSKDGDRRYDATQMSSIFDGIIEDGILQHYGTAMVVKESEGTIVNVGIGRAWFNHTWTLNDAILPITIPTSEIILNRIDAVVLEVDARESVRANQITVVKGTPSSSPSRPTLINTNDRWQYPLAYIYVEAGATSIRQSNITNMVGTSDCPYVTAPLEKMSIDDLIAQWADQWDEFYENQTSDMEATNALWKELWTTWYSSQTAEMKAANEFWKQQWKEWFFSYVNNYTNDMAEWRKTTESTFKEWFESLNVILEDDTAAQILQQLLELKEKVDSFEEFRGDLSYDFAIYYPLYDNGFRAYENLLDSTNDLVKDSNDEAIEGHSYSSEVILDSMGEQIETDIIFERR